MVHSSPPASLLPVVLAAVLLAGDQMLMISAVAEQRTTPPPAPIGSSGGKVGFEIRPEGQAPPSAPAGQRNGWGACAPGSKAANARWCDSTLSLPDRVDAFVANLTTQEKIARLIDLQAENSRLGVPVYSWNTEALHGLGASCVTASDGSARCPTIFPAPPGLGATWNRTLWRAEGEVIGDEARAYNNHGQHRNWGSRPIGINLWVPSLDLNRDPRGGRNEEVPAPYTSSA